MLIARVRETVTKKGVNEDATQRTRITTRSKATRKKTEKFKVEQREKRRIVSAA